MSTQTEFPKTLQEAIRYFADPDVSFRFMVGLRWPTGNIICPRCSQDDIAFIKSRRLLRCRACQKQFSVKVGTVMEDSPIELGTWLSAMWLIAGAKNGISSCETARALGVCQKTAWFLNHRIRYAMQQGSFEIMGGGGVPVEVDETFIGGKARNMHADRRAKKIKGTGGLASGKAAVMGLLERRSERRHSRVKVKVIGNTRKATLQPEIRASVEPGAQVMTDAHSGYAGLDAEYVHKVIDHAERYVDGIVHTNGLENFWSLLKRCINGTYVSVEPFHLFRYLDEQSFRFNERKENDQGRFLKVAGNIAGKRLTYKQLTGQGTM